MLKRRWIRFGIIFSNIFWICLLHLPRFPEAFFIDDTEVDEATPTTKPQFTPYNQQNDESNSNPSGFYTLQVDNQSVGSYGSYAYKFDHDDDEDLSEEADATGLHEDAYAQVIGDSEDDENLQEIKSNIPDITVSIGYTNEQKQGNYKSDNASSSSYATTLGTTYSSDSYDSYSSDEKSPSTSPKVSITPRNYRENIAQNQSASNNNNESDLLKKSNSLNSMTSMYLY